jgi:hypothetical protein
LKIEDCYTNNPISVIPHPERHIAQLVNSYFVNPKSKIGEPETRISKRETRVPHPVTRTTHPASIWDLPSNIPTKHQLKIDNAKY